MKPAIFNTDMVRAILDGRKTQTRRSIKLNGLTQDEIGKFWWESGNKLWDSAPLDIFIKLKSPYKKGDIIYVRETFIRGVEHDENDYPLTTEDGSDWIWKTHYRADNELLNWVDGDGEECNIPWKPSIHMPKEYARLFLRVKDVRIERLNEISREDAIAEGVDIHHVGYKNYYRKNDVSLYFMQAIKSFGSLWESIYGDGSFNDDYVWVIEFEKISKEEATNG